MRVEALSGAWCAMDYLSGKKPIVPEPKKPSPGSFKDILDDKMQMINGGKTLCGISSESLSQRKS